MCLNLGMHSSRREKHLNDENIFHLDVWRIKLTLIKHHFIGVKEFKSVHKRTVFLIVHEYRHVINYSSFLICLFSLEYSACLISVESSSFLEAYIGG